MSDKWQAQQQFWESFGWPAYDDQTTFTKEDLPAYPHITYESAIGTLGSETTLSVHLWNRATSWAEIKQKAEDIRDALSGGGVLVPSDDGYMWFKIPEIGVFARPFQSGSEDELVQRIMLNIAVEFLSD